VTSDMIGDITLTWVPLCWPKDKECPDKWIDRLGCEIGIALCGEWNEWFTMLAANLAMASLLCKAADIAYEHGVGDMNEKPYQGCGYPERAP
jgi:hypothetical protein